MSYRHILIVGICLAGLSIVLGAFAAHGLKQILTAKYLNTFEIGVRYQMYHAIALIIVGLAGYLEKFKRVYLSRAALAFVLGSTLFSGSLYLLALTQIKWLGMITPIGGICFVIGWTFFLFAIIKSEA
ncbi:MAG: DUF423 domain-containing protein [Kangiellaceae bacterium]|nr:DUF423 domain-containing protein [Kangiellaceae bacterium]